MKHIAKSKIILIIVVVLLSGCATSGVNVSTHITNVELGSGNYKLVARGVSGQASMEGVLGVSYGFGMGASQVAIIPISDNRMLYKTAMANLWSGFEQSNGNVVGRKLALINVRYDSEALNTLFYTKLTVAVIADVVEFAE